MRTVADYESLMGADALTPAEKKLIAAVRAGQPCGLQADVKTVPEADDNPAHTIRADLLALLITGGTPECGLSPFGVDLLGAYITGELRLTHLRAVGDTVLLYCRFAEKPNLRSAHFQTLNLTGSHLPGLMAQGAELGASLFLRAVTATGTVDVNAAKIGGQLVCEGATLNGAGKMALNAQRARVTEALVWQGVTVKSGHVSLAAAHVGDLWDDVGNWPDDLYLDGFTFDRFFGADTATAAKDRLPWLKKGSFPKGTFTPNPIPTLPKCCARWGMTARRGWC